MPDNLEDAKKDRAQQYDEGESGSRIIRVLPR